MDRIQINGFWYVREDTISKEPIELDPVHSESYTVENSDFCFEATRLFKDNGTPYDGIDIECTDKRFDNRKDWKVDHWDNNTWMIGILEDDPDSWKELPDMGNSNILYLQAFLQYLRDKFWL